LIGLTRSRNAAIKVARLWRIRAPQAQIRLARRLRRRPLRLTFLSPEAFYFAAIMNVTEAGGVPLGLLDLLNENVFSESCDILDSGCSSPFSNLFQRHFKHLSYFFELAG
jgi:hypothetical protein